MKNRKTLKILIVIGVILSQFSCKKFLEIAPPSNSLVPAIVFKSDDVATSAVLGIYSTMTRSGYASGDNNSISTICGLTADEYIAYNSNLVPFYTNQIQPDNGVITSIWASIYQRIYASNSVLEGLSATNSVSASVKSELQGEALFLRAFNYFYLVNLFGPVPLHLTTSLQLNTHAERAPVENVYKQIIADLKNAEALLGDSYLTSERIRPNKAAANALLARTFLYLQDWINAEIYSAKVIDKRDLYTLIPLDNIFLKNSQEAIWQLMPTANSNTNDGNLLILTTTPIQVSLSVDFAINSFEAGDHRKASWVRVFTNATGTYYHPYKYKVKSSPTVTEYSMVLRLAEQYLIRSEARANQNNLSGSLSDLNMIRKRASLADLSNNVSKSQLLSAIQKERSIELFSEWGHRWFDLKRTGNVTVALSTIKGNWQPTDILFPISKDEVTRNSNIIQNEGY